MYIMQVCIKLPSLKRSETADETYCERKDAWQDVLWLVLTRRIGPCTRQLGMHPVSKINETTNDDV